MYLDENGNVVDAAAEYRKKDPGALGSGNPMVGGGSNPMEGSSGSMVGTNRSSGGNSSGKSNVIMNKIMEMGKGATEPFGSDPRTWGPGSDYWKSHYESEYGIDPSTGGSTGTFGAAHSGKTIPQDQGGLISGNPNYDASASSMGVVQNNPDELNKMKDLLRRYGIKV